jgi:hypothetical protein
LPRRISARANSANFGGGVIETGMAAEIESLRAKNILLINSCGGLLYQPGKTPIKVL